MKDYDMERYYKSYIVCDLSAQDITKSKEKEIETLQFVDNIIDNIIDNIVTYNISD